MVSIPGCDPGHPSSILQCEILGTANFFLLEREGRRERKLGERKEKRKEKRVEKRRKAMRKPRKEGGCECETGVIGEWKLPFGRMVNL